jgi:hypothetical protein
MVGSDIDATIMACCATGAVTNTDGTYAGGLVGSTNSYSSVIMASCATGAVTTSGEIAGGLVGLGQGIITDCYATGAVTSTGNPSYAGGLVGIMNGGTITACYATGNVTDINTFESNLWVGGLVGDMPWLAGPSTTTNCYATGAVTGIGSSTPYSELFVGGLVGNNDDSPITNCYAAGAVTATGSSSPLSEFYVGGLIGRSAGNVTACFWDMETSGQTDSNGGIGLTTAEMMTQSTFTNAGWGFVGWTVNEANDIWRMCVDGVNYPKLSWEYAKNGDFLCPDGVDFADFSFFAEHWLNTNCATNNNCDGTDLDLSGTVDWNDLMIFCQHWLEGVTL